MKPATAFRIILLTAVAVGLGPGAMAQFLENRFGPALTSEDVRYLLNASNELNERPQLKPGQSMSWTNPTTKAHGTIRVTRIYHSGDTICHALRYNSRLPRAIPGHTT